MDDEIRIWLNFAEIDLGVAKHLNETYYPKPVEVICYHCQQSAEKAIKALMIKAGYRDNPPKTHNLSFLLQQIKKMIDIPEEYYDKADILTPYGIAARYPNELLIEEKHVAEAIESAGDILQWVQDATTKRIS